MKTILYIIAITLIGLGIAPIDTDNRPDVFKRSFYTKVQQSQPVLKMAGLKVYVDDLARAEKFYVDFLGFKLLKKERSLLILETNTYPIHIALSQARIDRDIPAQSHTGMSLLVHKLLPSIEVFRSYGYKVYDSLLSRNGVGIDVPIEDPSGNFLHLIEVQIREVPPFEGFRVYNSGLVVSDISKAEEFYIDKLGFEAWSRSYLPDALPLKHNDGSFAFMLHQDTSLTRNTATYGVAPQLNLIFTTPDLEDAKKALLESNIEYVDQEDKLLVKDTYQNLIEIIQTK